MARNSGNRRPLAWFLAACLTLGLLGPGSVLAGGTFAYYEVEKADDGAAAHEEALGWFVELTGAPVSEVDSTMTEGQRAAHRIKLEREHETFRKSSREAGIAFRERHAFTGLWNGLSIRTGRENLSAIVQLPGVKAIWPVQAVTPDLASSTDMIAAPAVRAAYGVDGTGVRVAVMDTGIDYNHPDLGACFGPGCRVAKGYDFVGDAFNAQDPDNDTPAPDADPMDCNGHGTHVAGIIGARAAGANGVTGVAPGVTFLAYKVFGCVGSTTEDIMLAAMERALADGAQVLNMSIGSAFQWPDYPTAKASSNLVNKGVVVVASAGNSGASGQYSLSAPSVGHKVISVASVENTMSQSRFFTLDDSAVVPHIPMAGAPAAPSSGTLAVATALNLGCDAGDFRNGDGSSRVTGKAALIARGVCPFAQKALHAQAAGAEAAVIANNTAGTLSGTVAGSPVTIPTVGIGLGDGNLIRSRLASGSVALTWQAGNVAVPNPAAMTISSFSSAGPAPTLDFKPDIAAPGGSIYSTYPLTQGGYASLSGTSMAAPHTAGAAALLLAARPKTKATAVRTILQNTAAPLGMGGVPGLSPVAWQGAGMVNMLDALRNPLRAEPAKLALGELEGGASATRSLTLNNSADTALTYSVAAVTANSFSANKYSLGVYAGFANPVTLSAASVTVPVNGQATLDVTVGAFPLLPDGVNIGGWIELTPSDPSLPTVRVPYTAFKGDYQSIPVFTGVASLAVPGPAPGSWVPVPSLTQPHGNVAADWIVHLHHQVPKLRLSARGTTNGRNYNRVLEAQWLPRNSAPGAVHLLTWDGKDHKGRDLPPGTYTLTVSAWKALGDDDHPDHQETVQIGTLTITQP